ncbi:MAG: phosphoribosylglycinamide formyltransferase [Rubricoccaceae bacterium]
MRLAFFASGGGSNVQAILDAIDTHQLDAEPVLLISDRPGCGALSRASTRGLPTVVMPPKDYPDESAFGDALLTTLRQLDVDTLALAGYLKKIPRDVVQAFSGRILNVHPSLLPAFGGPGFYGRRVHQAVLNAGCRVSGATVHLVDAEYDTGPILLQGCVPVEESDTPESLAARVLSVEHSLFPRALDLLAADRIQIDGRRARILPLPS